MTFVGHNVGHESNTKWFAFKPLRIYIIIQTPMRVDIIYSKPNPNNAPLRLEFLHRALNKYNIAHVVAQ